MPNFETLSVNPKILVEYTQETHQTSPKSPSATVFVISKVNILSDKYFANSCRLLYRRNVGHLAAHARYGTAAGNTKRQLPDKIRTLYYYTAVTPEFVIRIGLSSFISSFIAHFAYRATDKI
jgi:hypothetical protein